MFTFCYEIANKKTVIFFYYGLITFISATAIASIGANLFPQLGKSLPDMNLLFPLYGHNYLAHLLMFLTPITMYKAIQNKKWIDYVLLLLNVGMLILTFARGAWIIIAFYILTIAVAQKKLLYKTQRFLFILIPVLFIILFITLFHSNNPYALLKNNDKQFIKQFITKETPIQNRTEYWSQSIQAIQERPIFGSGPGTFFLQSQRLQRRPMTYSLFAHSFPLQILVEFGSIGAILILGLFFLIFKQILRRIKTLDEHTKRYVIPLLWGSILTGIYSSYEFNLDFLVIWLLFWMILGICIGLTNNETKKQKKIAIPSRIAFVCLIIFYTLLLSGMLMKTAKDQTTALYIMPFHTKYAVEYVENQQKMGGVLTQRQIDILLFFHKNNPEIIQAILQINANTLSESQKNAMNKQLIYLYPKNELYHKQYIDFLINQKDYKNAGIQILRYTLLFLPQYADIFNTTGPLQQQEIIAIAKHTGELTNEKIIHEKRIARLFYLAGFADSINSPTRTKTLWHIASQLDPGLSYYYVELASLTKNILHDTEAVGQILVDCKKNTNAAEHCIEVEQNGLPEIGSLKNAILSFP